MLLQALIELGADVNAQSVVSAAGSWQALPKLLMLHWCGPCMQDRRTPLSVAAKLGNAHGTAVCKLLLDAEADPNFQTGVSSLMHVQPSLQPALQ